MEHPKGTGGGEKSDCNYGSERGEGTRGSDNGKEREKMQASGTVVEREGRVRGRGQGGRGGERERVAP